MNIIKSIGALLAGIFTVSILTIIADAVLQGIGFYPPLTKSEEYTTLMYIIGLAYRTGFSILGGLVVAKLAPSRPMGHVYVLAAIGLVLGVAGIFSLWNTFEHWYPIAQAALTAPAIWYGGKLAVGKKQAA